MKLGNFAEVSAQLARFVERKRLPGSYSLTRMWQLMEFLDNPQDKLKVVHVAGTSGKTSTAYYAAALLHAAGFTVGLTVSPHVAEVNERLQINLTPLPETEFCHMLSEFLKLVEASKLEPTYFETLIGFVYWELARRRVDYAVIEVGLGGLMDGTNVVRRRDKVCVLTDIGLDHMHVLGNTLAEIAAHKAGIIQPGNNVFCYYQSAEVDEVFAVRAAEQQAALNFVENLPTAPELAFLPLFQQRNFQLARAAVEYVLQRDASHALTPEQLQTAAHALIPGRMEIFRHKGKTIILDGAHNAQKLQALTASLQAQFPNQSVAALVSFTDNREEQLADALTELKKIRPHLIATTFPTAQDLPHLPINPTTITDTARQLGYSQAEAVADSREAFTVLLARPEPLLLVTGSFYLLSALRPIILAAEPFLSSPT